jgi:hypothetical protein
MPDLTLVDGGKPQEPAPETTPPQSFVPPQPLPEHWHVETVAGPQGNVVVISISGPWGVHVHFLPRDGARAVASDIRKQAEAGPGIILAPAGSVPV